MVAVSNILRDIYEGKIGERVAEQAIVLAKMIAPPVIIEELSEPCECADEFGEVDV